MARMRSAWNTAGLKRGGRGLESLEYSYVPRCATYVSPDVLNLCSSISNCETPSSSAFAQEMRFGCPFVQTTPCVGSVMFQST